MEYEIERIEKVRVEAENTTDALDKAGAAFSLNEDGSPNWIVWRVNDREKERVYTTYE